MKKALIAVMILCMTVLFFPLNALADDGVLGGTGMTVYPIKDTKVVMEKEIIDITVKDGCSYVNCQFWFHNTGKKTSLLVGFPTVDPEYSGADMSDPDADTTLYSFKTYINGNRVPVKVKSGLKPRGNNKDDLYYPQWYTWNMNFAAGQRIKVVNSYWLKNSYGGEDSEYVNYILRSGSTWKGTIGKVTVRMKLSGYDDLGPYFNDMLPTYIENDGTIVWEAENIEPDKDIEAVTSSSSEYFDNPFNDETRDSYLYDKMGTRLLNNFYSGHYNGVTWWGHRFIKEFGDKQSQEFYYMLGVSYYKKGEPDAALDNLNKVTDPDDTYYLPSLYYKALVYSKTGDTEKYTDCINTLNKCAEASMKNYGDLGSLDGKDYDAYLDCQYYEALLYKRSGDIGNYRDCLNNLISFDSNDGDQDSDAGIDWMHLWAQSRLKDLGIAG